MSYAAETFQDRVVRLLGASLRNPEKTRELLARVSETTKQEPQPGSKPVEDPAQPLEQAELL
jgi:hypothetical protein